MNTTSADQWGVCGRQLNALSKDVKEEIRAERTGPNPNVITVVKEYIIPKCTADSVSYSILINPNGLKCDTFVSHAWLGPFFALIDELRGYYEDFETRVFWIDFLAAPQTWPSQEADRLMFTGAVVHSRFATALLQCDHVVVVRNTNCNLYTRLWCVAELALAREFKKSVKVIGIGPPMHESGIGTRAQCSVPADEPGLQAAISKVTSDAHIDELVEKAVKAPAGSVLAVGATDFEDPNSCCVQ